MSSARLLTPAEYRRVPWKNGGGVSTTIAAAQLDGAAEGDWAGTLWQLGRTRISAPAPFSDLAGFERLQVVVAGSGLVLDTPAGEMDLRQPLQPVRYDGGVRIVSRLEDGPVEVVNLIARRDLCTIDMRVLHAGETLATGAGVHFLYAPMADAAIQRDGGTMAVPADHALALEGRADVVCVAGVLVAASITVHNGGF